MRQEYDRQDGNGKFTRKERRSSIPQHKIMEWILAFLDKFKTMWQRRSCYPTTAGKKCEKYLCLFFHTHSRSWPQITLPTTLTYFLCVLRNNLLNFPPRISRVTTHYYNNLQPSQDQCADFHCYISALGSWAVLRLMLVRWHSCDLL